MIISHARRFIFVKTMKVAGSSLEIALSKHCGENDILTPFGQKDEQIRNELGYTSSRGWEVPLARYDVAQWGRLILRRRRAKRFYGHDRAAAIRRTVGDEIWNDYLKISAVRNPFDYAVSRYYWEGRLGPLPEFREWLLENPEMLLENRRITHIDGRNAMDFMIRYEHLDEDLTRLSEQLGLSSNLHEDLRGIHAKGDRRPEWATVAEHFDGFDEGVRLVEILCREDIETYGYALDRTRSAQR